MDKIDSPSVKKTTTTKRLETSHIYTAEKIHSNVSRVAFQRVHTNWIKLPILPSSDKVSIA